jgi:hypothetical protein
MTNTQLKLPPVVKSIVVARGADDAFEIYTRDIGKWWPTGTHSIGRAEVANVLIEPRIGGRIFERWKDGTEKLWGTISVWEKGQRLVHSWHVSTDPDHASKVECNSRHLEAIARASRLSIAIGSACPASRRRKRVTATTTAGTACSSSGSAILRERLTPDRYRLGALVQECLTS